MGGGRRQRTMGMLPRMRNFESNVALDLEYGVYVHGNQI